MNEIDCSRVCICRKSDSFEQSIKDTVQEGCFCQDSERVYLTEATGELIETINHELMHYILYKFVSPGACNWYDEVAKIVDPYHRGDQYHPTKLGLREQINWAILRHIKKGLAFSGRYALVNYISKEIQQPVPLILGNLISETLNLKIEILMEEFKNEKENKKYI